MDLNQVAKRVALNEPSGRPRRDLFPLISEVGGYPPGIEKSDFNLLVPFESDRSKWKTLRGISLKDEKIYRICSAPR